MADRCIDCDKILKDKTRQRCTECADILNDKATAWPHRSEVPKDPLKVWRRKPRGAIFGSHSKEYVPNKKPVYDGPKREAMEALLVGQVQDAMLKNVRVQGKFCATDIAREQTQLRKTIGLGGKVCEREVRYLRDQFAENDPTFMAKIEYCVTGEKPDPGFLRDAVFLADALWWDCNAYALAALWGIGPDGATKKLARIAADPRFPHARELIQQTRDTRRYATLFDMDRAYQNHVERRAKHKIRKSK